MKIIPNANHLNHPHSTETHGKARSGAKWFRDIVDLINPLHHIPLVGTLYRKITGDEMGAVINYDSFDEARLNQKGTVKKLSFFLNHSL